MLENLLREPIARFMTTNIKSASPHDTIEKSALTLLKSSFRRLPILNSEHRLLGVVNSNDILTIMYRKLIINQSDIPHLLRTRLSAHMWVHYSVLSPDTPLINAVRTLHRKCIGCIAILRDTRLVGIFTERDLTRVAAQQDFGQRVVEYMTREFFHQPKKASILDAMRYMIEMGIRRIPIFEGDNVVGLVTEKDILSYLFEETTLAKLGKNGVEVLASKKVEDCMTTDFPKIFPQAKVSYAAGLMSEGGKGCLIVYDGYKPRGIITEKDLVRALLRL